MWIVYVYVCGFRGGWVGEERNLKHEVKMWETHRNNQTLKHFWHSKIQTFKMEIWIWNIWNFIFEIWRQKTQDWIEICNLKKTCYFESRQLRHEFYGFFLLSRIQKVDIGKWEGTWVYQSKNENWEIKSKMESITSEIGMSKPRNRIESWNVRILLQCFFFNVGLGWSKNEIFSKHRNKWT